MALKKITVETNIMNYEWFCDINWNWAGKMLKDYKPDHKIFKTWLSLYYASFIVSQKHVTNWVLPKMAITN